MVRQDYGMWRAYLPPLRGIGRMLRLENDSYE